MHMGACTGKQADKHDRYTEEYLLTVCQQPQIFLIQKMICENSKHNFIYEAKDD